MEAQPNKFWQLLERALPLGDRRQLLGLSFILLVAIIWVAASFFVQGLEEHGAHPAVLTFVANSLFAVYLPIYYLNLRLRRRSRQRTAAGTLQQRQETTALVPVGQLRSDADLPASPLPADDSVSKGLAHAPPSMPMRQLFRAALIVAPLWYMAQFTFNMSLARTSVTSNTILSSTSALFTFLFAVLLLGEAFTLWKLGFILLLMAGTAMVTLADAGVGSGGGSDSQGLGNRDLSAGKNSVIGDLLCLVSAVVYGAYTVSIRKLLGEDDETPMIMFFGFMGALIFLGVGPLILVLKLAGVGLGTLTWKVFGLMVVKGLLDNVLSDYLWARAILLVGPTIATSGLSMQVPLAVVLDPLLRHPAWMQHVGSIVLTLVGGVVVLVGFFGVNAAGSADEHERHVQWEQQQEALREELEFMAAGEDESEVASLSERGSVAWRRGEAEEAAGYGEEAAARAAGSSK